jgi:hypothetical protein
MKPLKEELLIGEHALYADGSGLAANAARERVNGTPAQAVLC